MHTLTSLDKTANFSTKKLFSLGKKFAVNGRLDINGFKKWRQELYRQSKATNKEFRFDTKDAALASMEASLLTIIFGDANGETSFDVLEKFFVNEQFPDSFDGRRDITVKDVSSRAAQIGIPF
jgi:hypothetical protein